MKHIVALDRTREATIPMRAIRAITTGHSNRRRTQSSDFLDLHIFAPENVEDQVAISNRVSAAEREVLSGQAEHRELLGRVDRLILGEVGVADVVA